VEKVIDNEKLDYYISKYDIDEIFSIDMKPYMELFLFNKNEHICKADEKLMYLFFFVEGKAKVYTSLSNGKSLLLCFYKPFKILGDVEFIHFETADSNVQAIEETYCVGIALENIRKLVLDDSKFLRFICDCLGEKLTRLSKYSSINLLYPLENRLASFILATTSSSKSQGSSIIFDGNLSEISELLGTSYRHLLRTLNTLCWRNAIKKNEHCYEILDAGTLERLAGELYE
jgi:CRP/FNR family transcriptional regulator, putaive post-exponential-phase nitrogen-starvation regulator